MSPTTMCRVVLCIQSHHDPLGCHVLSMSFFPLKLVCPFVPYLFQTYLINYCEQLGERRFNYACLPTSPLGCINYHVCTLF